MRTILMLVSTCAAFAQQPTRGSIFGMVKGEDGTTIREAQVILRWEENSAPARPKRSAWERQTGDDGGFRFDGLPNGDYRLCVQAKDPAWLNPCEWGQKAPAATISSLRQSAELTHTLEKGALVAVRIDDPGGFLIRTPAAHVLVGVGNDAGMFHPASITSTDRVGRNLQLAIPFDRPSKIAIGSSVFRLADAQGLAQPAFRSVPLTVPRGVSPSILRVIIIGSGK